ncbi:hypothetical protein ABTX35_03530 [Streptomyces sp. NPDC096080]|uniref:hypothetical protein n=1 Tax=Streptomyces sp. NPDC096080 TaxID=3156693 RepID=UPI00332F6A86
MTEPEAEPYQRLLDVYFDIGTGSRILVRLARNAAREGIQAARGAPTATPVKKDKSSEETKEQEAPAPEASKAPEKPGQAPPDSEKPKTEKPGSEKPKSAKGKPKAPKRGFVLFAVSADRAALAAGVGWVGWCFLHRPVQAGLHALVPELVAAAPGMPVAWCAAAVAAARLEKRSKAREDDGDGETLDGEPDAAEEADEPDGPPDEAAVRGGAHWLLRTVCERVAAAVAAGRKGIHLRDLLDEPGVPDTWDVSVLRAHCGRVGIPVKQMQIRGSGTGPTHGVHVDELVTALGVPVAHALHLLRTRADVPPADLPAGLSGEGKDASPHAPAGGESGAPAGGDEEAAVEVLEGWLQQDDEGRPSAPASTTSHTPLPAALTLTHGRG